MRLNTLGKLKGDSSVNRQARPLQLLKSLLVSLMNADSPAHGCKADRLAVWHASVCQLISASAYRLAGEKIEADSHFIERIDELISSVRTAGMASLPGEESGDGKLASIYELILHLEPQFSTAQAGEAVFSVNEKPQTKKRAGAFYSPSPLVDLVIEQVLGNVVGNGTIDEIARIRIIDPAMGAGIFIIRAVRFLKEKLLALGASEDESNRIARQCVFGIDLDPLAVHVACWSLWLVLKERTLDPASAFPNLHTGNALLGARLDTCFTFPFQAVCRKKIRLDPPLIEQLKGKFECISERNHAGAARGDKDALRSQMDLWCALWFMNETELRRFAIDDSLDEIIGIQKERHKFLHLELEFAEGFDAVVGNPPWEIEKPNTREFFGGVQPSYWSLGKQAALNMQQRLLSEDATLRRHWQERNEYHARFINWIKQAPVQLDKEPHPFAWQGRGDINLYKLFVEQAYYLTREGGCFSLIVPAGLYTDSGSKELRQLLLRGARWSKLFGFDNRDGAFAIHRSFKYCVFTAGKIAMPDSDEHELEARFLLVAREADWIDANFSACTYKTTAIEKLSPKWLILPEVENSKTLELLERIYDGACLLANFKAADREIAYKREFDMTLDSSLFHGRDELEAAGFIQDIYGNWHRGKWHRHDTSTERLVNLGFVQSASGVYAIACEDIERTCLPLYEGRMVGQFDDNQKHWIEGKGRRAQWQPPGERPGLGPQYLVFLEDYKQRRAAAGIKTGFLAVGSPSNARTMIASVLTDVACGNSVPVLYPSGSQSNLQVDWQDEELALALCACLNSFVFDFVIRRRMSGNNLNYFILEECPLPTLSAENSHCWRALAELSRLLSCSGYRYARELLKLGKPLFCLPDQANSRRILRACSDVLVAELYGLNREDMSTILTDSRPIGGAASKDFSRVEKDFPRSARYQDLVLSLMSRQDCAGSGVVPQFLGEPQMHAAILDALLT